MEDVKFYYTLAHKDEWSSFGVILAVIANVIVMGYLIYQFLEKLSKVELKRIKISLLVFDGIYFIINIGCIFLVLMHNVFEDKVDRDTLAFTMKTQRILYSILSITIWTKSLEYLKLF